ncbi:hypothetical protein TeGR_g8023 [Tetraparma gracilis]|uniref:Uncharacterized protein n=1 Tax=Tetraparma gracilis TaxID=2962635 RepID=A0ABQ6NBU9_9STRA|nr:hypothetical protein TeGR_g8023 [Tetraparma gracilis]
MKVFLRQFRALAYKNFKMRVRHPIQLLFELGLPVAVFALFIWIRSQSGDGEGGVVEAAVLESAQPVVSYDDLLGNYPPSRVCGCYNDCSEEWSKFILQGSTGASIFDVCDKRGCSSDGESADAYCRPSHMAVVGGAGVASGDDAADQFEAWITGKFPDTFAE